MDIQQQYAPKPNVPIFDTEPVPGVILVAAYATVGGSWNPTWCGAGRLAEPWLPGSRAIFSEKESTLQQVPFMEGSRIHVTTYVREGLGAAGILGRPTEHAVAVVQHPSFQKDKGGYRMYMLMEDVDCVGHDLLDHVQERRYAKDLSHAKFMGWSMNKLARIAETMTAARRSLNRQFVAFMP